MPLCPLSAVLAILTLRQRSSGVEQRFRNLDDFLLLDRPVLIYLLDFAHYEEIRGFKLEPLEFWMPGPMVSSVERLVTEVDGSLSDPAR